MGSSTRLSDAAQGLRMRGRHGTCARVDGEGRRRDRAIAMAEGVSFRGYPSSLRKKPSRGGPFRFHDSEPRETGRGLPIGRRDRVRRRPRARR